MTTVTIKPDRDEDMRQRFLADTSEHEMTVILDDGLHRHLRFRQPGTIMYGYELVTWPGYLAIVGDCGDYMFSRIADMFEFFEADNARINPQYWAEKLQGPGHDPARSYDQRRFVEAITQWADDVVDGEFVDADDVDEFRAAVQDQILSRSHYDEHEARQLLDAFTYERVRIDSWEWDFRDYTHRFLWCCWAIAYGIRQYRALPVKPARRWWQVWKRS